MNLDSVSLKAVVNESRPLLIGGILQKISQITRFDLLLHIRQPQQSIKIVINLQPSHTRLSLVEGKMPPAQVPTSFIMLLRKRLQGKRITGLSQCGLERAVALEFADWTLIIEIPGKQNNAILVNKSNIVMGLLFSETRGERNLKPGKAYEPYAKPPKPDVSLVEAEHIRQALTAFLNCKAKASICHALFGIPPVHAGYLCQRAGIEPDGLLDELNVVTLTNTIANWCEQLSAGNYEPVSFPDGNVSPWTLGRPGEMRHANMRDALECGMALPGVEDAREELAKLVAKSKAKSERALANRIQDLENANSAPQYCLKGELLLAYLAQIPEGAPSVSLPDGHGNLIDIKLDEHLTPSDNAQKYFKEYKRLKRAQEALQAPIQQAEMEIRFDDEILLAIETSASIEELEEIRSLWQEEKGTCSERCRRHATIKPLGPRRFRHNGFLILVGRNPRQNDRLTVKIASTGDLWFHARGIPGAHVLLRTAGRIPEIATIEAAAFLAAKYSRAAESTLVAVSYTDARHVHKPKGSPPGRVVMKTERTITVSPHVEVPDLLEEPNVPCRGCTCTASGDEEPAVVASEYQDELLNPLSLASPHRLHPQRQHRPPHQEPTLPNLASQPEQNVVLAVEIEDELPRDLGDPQPQDETVTRAQRQAITQLKHLAERNSQDGQASHESLEELKAQAQAAATKPYAGRLPRNAAHPEPQTGAPGSFLRQYGDHDSPVNSEHREASSI